MHLALVIGGFLLTCLILVLTRNFLNFDFPLFEEIIFVSSFSALLTLGLTLYLKMTGFLKDSIRLLAYVNIIALMFSILFLPYCLLNVDRSRSFYVLGWVEQGRVSVENSQIILRVKSTESADIAGVHLRLMEQKQRGLIQVDDGIYRVTNMGKLTLEIANLLANIFNLTNWELNKN
jgi:hypothetical protein